MNHSYLILLLLIGSLFLFSCDDSNQTHNNITKFGHLNEPCLENETCLDNLSCENDICVESKTSPCDSVECPANSSCIEIEETAKCQCDEGTFNSLDGNCVIASSPTKNEFHSVEFVHGIESRYYYLYIPHSYKTEIPSSVLVDLHGTASNQPEEAYGLEFAKEASERDNFILLRPRSRSSMEGDYQVYRWDQNPGDTDLNHQFIMDLVVYLSNIYNIDPERLYVMGFSSGTNQTARELTDESSIFSGFGFVGGGIWNSRNISILGNVYMATGYRDYMRAYHYDLVSRLEGADYPEEKIFEHQLDAGHDLYPFVYDEIFPFLDGGTRPDPGAIVSSWSDSESILTNSILDLHKNDIGKLFAFGANNTILSKDGTSSWVELNIDGQPFFQGRAFTSACFTIDGTGVAVGEGQLALSPDNGNTWSYNGRISETDQLFGYQYINSISCDGSRVSGIGYWQGVTSTDGGVSWSDIYFNSSYGYAAQGATISSSPWHTWVAGGYYNYLGYSNNGVDFTASYIDNSCLSEWFYDVQPISLNSWVAVGDYGSILKSDDDGANFICKKCDISDNLFAVSFMGNEGLAVGQNCTAFYTDDGGETWSDVSCGLNIFLGAVNWIEPGKAIATGEDGKILTFTR